MLLTFTCMSEVIYSDMNHSQACESNMHDRQRQVQTLSGVAGASFSNSGSFILGGCSTKAYS